MKITEEYYKELLEQLSENLIESQGDFDFYTREFSIESSIDFINFRVSGRFSYVVEGDGYHLPRESWVTSITVYELDATIELLFKDDYDANDFIGVDRLVKDLNKELQRIDH